MYACTHVVLFPSQRPQSLVWEQGYSGHVKSRVDQLGSQLTAGTSLPVVAAKAYALGKALHIAVLKK